MISWCRERLLYFGVFLLGTYKAGIFNAGGLQSGFPSHYIPDTVLLPPTSPQPP